MKESSTVAIFTATQAHRLAAVLAAPDRPDGTMTYYEAAGFLFAVACAPEIVMPSEWLPHIFGESGGIFRDEAEAREAYPLILALYNFCTDGAQRRTPVMPPNCAARTPALANLEPDAPLSQWAKGFVYGHHWLSKSWDDMLPDELSGPLGADLMVLSFFDNQKMAEAFLKEVAQPGLTLEHMADTALELLPEAMQDYARIGHAMQDVLRDAQTHPPQQPARADKIGRNDPCPCGSGKKYKKCCGSGQVADGPSAP